LRTDAMSGLATRKIVSAANTATSATCCRHRAGIDDDEFVRTAELLQQLLDRRGVVRPGRSI
jgi:hypothetical protein